MRILCPLCGNPAPYTPIEQTSNIKIEPHAVTSDIQCPATGTTIAKPADDLSDEWELVSGPAW